LSNHEFVRHWVSLPPGILMNAALPVVSFTMSRQGR
jgi:hypothetical protein